MDYLIDLSESQPNEFDLSDEEDDDGGEFFVDLTASSQQGEYGDNTMYVSSSGSAHNSNSQDKGSSSSRKVDIGNDVEFVEDTRGASSSSSSSRKRSNSNNNNSDVEFVEDTRGTSSSSSSSRKRSNNSNNNNNSDVEFVEDTSSSSSVLQTPLQRVLYLFPQASLPFVGRLLQQRKDPETVIGLMLDAGYEKAVPAATSANVQETEISIDYTDTKLVTSMTYRKDAEVRLKNLFPWFTIRFIRAVFQGNHFHFYHTVQSIKRELNLEEFKPALLGAKPGVALTKAAPLPPATADRVHRLAAEKYPRMQWKAHEKLLVQSPAVCHTITVTDADLKGELAWMQRLEDEKSATAEALRREEAQYEAARLSGSLVECACCYGDFTFDNMVQCTDGHLFCKQCLKLYIEQCIFGDGKTELKCMYSATPPCAGKFAEAMIEKCLPEKVYSKYSEALTRDALKLAKIDNLVSCHACSLPVEMPQDAGNYMTCPSCSQQTCRSCGGAEHIPLRCSEVENKSHEMVRLAVEEAMTKARLRECPNPRCKSKFYKVEGCNKMSCVCGTKMCYVCRSDVTKTMYNHFCQTPHCNHEKCGRCVLYSDTVEDDRRAMYEAAVEAKAASAAPAELSSAKSSSVVAAAAAVPSGVNGEVNIESLLEGGALKKVRPGPAQPRGGVIVPRRFIIPPHTANLAAERAAQQAAAMLLATGLEQHAFMQNAARRGGWPPRAPRRRGGN